MIKYTQQFKLTAIQAFLDRGYGFRHIAGRFQIDPSIQADIHVAPLARVNIAGGAGGALEKVIKTIK